MKLEFQLIVVFHFICFAERESGTKASDTNKQYELTTV